MRLITAERLANLNEITLEKAFRANGLIDMKIEVIRDVNVREHDVVYTVDFTDDDVFESHEDLENVKVYVKMHQTLGFIIADV